MCRQGLIYGTSSGFVFCLCFFHAYQSSLWFKLQKNLNFGFNTVQSSLEWFNFAQEWDTHISSRANLALEQLLKDGMNALIAQNL